MTRVVEAQAVVEDILDVIQKNEHLNRWVPHGFKTISIAAEMAPSLFPEGAEHPEVKLRLELPVIYSAQNSRAALPAQRDNLSSLRAWIERELRNRATRLALSNWEVSPDSDPEPNPDAIWTVDSVIREY
jgi:hypothetical protein